MSRPRDLVKKWALRYLKYNIIGLSVFTLNLVLYFFLFNFLGEWAYIAVSVDGGIIEFALISYLNRTKKGIIFDSCSPVEEK